MTVNFAFPERSLNISIDLVLLRISGDFMDRWMLWSQAEESCSKDRLRPGGEDRDRLSKLGFKVDLAAFRSPDPVALDGLNGFRPFDLI